MTADPSTPCKRLRRWSHFSLRTLFLVLLVVAIVLGLGPGLLEEINSIESGAILTNFKNSRWGSGPKSSPNYQTQMLFASEGPFHISFSIAELESTQPNGEPPFTQTPEGKTFVGRFDPKRQIVGHNYKLSLLLEVRGGTFRIGSDEYGWHESTLLDENDEQSWSLVDTNMTDMRNRLLNPRVGYAAGEWIFATQESLSEPNTRYKGFTIWIDLSDR